MTEEVAESGYRAATVARVIQRAGVSRATFYELFADRQACFTAAQTKALRSLKQATAQASRFDTVLATLDDIHPGAFELIFSASPLAGPNAAKRYQTALNTLAKVDPSTNLGAAIALRAHRRHDPLTPLTVARID